jgi:N-acetyl-gamma-glutamylphosphate reductase
LNLQVEELEAFKTKLQQEMATNKEYQKVTLPSNPDSFSPMQIDKISHIAVKCCQAVSNPLPIKPLLKSFTNRDQLIQIDNLKVGSGGGGRS